jgi:hypothetical protein
MSERKNRLGLDFEGVICQRPKDVSIVDDDRYLERPFVPGAVESVRRLVAELFGENVWIVSTCRLAAEPRMLHLLDHHNFWHVTGVRRDHMLFCREHGGKAPVCERLGITHFVDDRFEVLSAMSTVLHRFVFQPRLEQESEKPFLHLASQMRVVQSWDKIIKELLSK